MNSRKRKIIVVVIGGLFVLLVGGGIIFAFFASKDKQEATSQPTKNPPSSPNDDNPPPPSQPDDKDDKNSEKKTLAKEIKEDLQKDLEEAKKEEKSKRGFGGCTWLVSLGEDCSDYRGNERRLCHYDFVEDTSGKKYKEVGNVEGIRGINIFPEKLEPDDWKEIEGLIQQIKELEKKKKEKEDQKDREERAKEQAQIDQKLNSNPKMFLYEGWKEWAVDYDPRGYDKFRVFRGMENGQAFHLAFPENHPLVANFSYNQNREKNIFQIEGVENTPFQPKEKNNKGLPWKKVNLSDKITITPINS